MKMNSIRLLARLIVAAGVLVTPAHAQDDTKTGRGAKADAERVRSRARTVE